MSDFNDIPWPNALDVPFTAGPGFENADVHSVTRRPNDELIAEGFKRMADYAVAALERGEESSPERLLFPVGYNYRHFIELSLKCLIRAGRELEVIDDVDTVLGRHDLRNLWAKTREALDVLFAEDDPAPMLAAERIILDFHELDGTGQAFRCSRDKADQPHLADAPSHVSLFELRRVMDGLANFLSGCSCTFMAAIDHNAEMKRYYDAH